MADDANQAGQSQIKSFMQRYERLLKEKAETEDCIRELLAEVKGNGFDVATFKKVQKKRAQDQAHVAEQDAIERLYTEACR